MESKSRAEPLPSRRSDELPEVHCRFAAALGGLCPFGTVSQQAGPRPKKALAGLRRQEAPNLNIVFRWSLTWGPPHMIHPIDRIGELLHHNWKPSAS